MSIDRPSRTAQVVAASVAIAESDPIFEDVLPPGVSSEIARYLCAIDGWPGTATRIVGSLPRSITRSFARLVSKEFAHVVLRKRWIEDIVRAELADCTQVVVVGAGFDTLASRLHREHPTVRFYEVDHPATQRPKRRALDSDENLVLVAADLTERSLAAVLGDTSGYEPDANTIVVAEGLLMYLPRRAVRELFAAFRSRTGSGSWLVATAWNPEADTARGSPLWSLVGEPIQWGVPPGRLPSVLGAQSLEVRGLAETRHLRAQYLPGRPEVPVMDFEYFFAAAPTAT